jgi:hypothetical protein
MCCVLYCYSLASCSLRDRLAYIEPPCYIPIQDSDYLDSSRRYSFNTARYEHFNRRCASIPEEHLQKMPRSMVFEQFQHNVLAKSCSPRLLSVCATKANFNVTLLLGSYTIESPNAMSTAALKQLDFPCVALSCAPYDLILFARFSIITWI